MKQKIAIFLSGSGSNARAICQYFDSHSAIEVALLLSNREDSGIKSIGEAFQIPFFVFNRTQFYQEQTVLEELEQHNIDAIVLAGFLWLIPASLLERFPDKIINIHPALLPKYGGKGMHGLHVHEAVWKNKETESGITIHLCNKEYDKGQVLLQQKVTLSERDTPTTIANKVLSLEHTYYAPTIEAYLLQ